MSTREDELRQFLVAMHGMAAEYHIHFSTVRTTISGIFAPIVIGGSLSLFFDHPSAKWKIWIAACLLLLLLIWMNLIFAQWSKICRKLESFYEQAVGRLHTVHGPRANQDPVIVGFRSLFRTLNVRLKRAPKGGDPQRAWSDTHKDIQTWLGVELPERVGLRSALFDVFQISVIAGSGLYLLLFALLDAPDQPVDQSSTPTARLEMSMVYDSLPFDPGEAPLAPDERTQVDRAARERICPTSAAVDRRPVLVIGSNDRVEINPRSTAFRSYDTLPELALQRAQSVARVIAAACPTVSVIPLISGPQSREVSDNHGRFLANPLDRKVRVWSIDAAGGSSE